MQCLIVISECFLPGQQHFDFHLSVKVHRKGKYNKRCGNHFGLSFSPSIKMEGNMPHHDRIEMENEMQKAITWLLGVLMFVSFIVHCKAIKDENKFSQ